MTTYTYDADGELDGVRRNDGGGDGTLSRYGYTDENSLVAHSMTTVYAPVDAVFDDQPWDVTAATDALLTNVYNATTGKLSTTTDANGHTVSYDTTPSSDGGTETVTDRRGNQTVYTYDLDGNVTSTALPDGETSTAVYQPGTHNELAATDAAGLTHYYTYDSQGHQTSDTYTIDSITITTSSTYRTIANQQVLSQTVDANGVKTTYTYDTHAQLIDVTTHDANSGWLSETTYPAQMLDGAPNYTASGLAQVQVQYAGENMPALWTQTSYDDFGNVLAVNTYAYPDGHTGPEVSDDPEHPIVLTLVQRTTNLYDASGRQVSSTQWNTTSPPGVADAPTYTDAVDNSTWYAYATTWTRYNSQSRVMATMQLGAPSVDAPDATTYDAAEADTAVNLVTQTIYNDAGQVYQSIDPRGIITEYHYDDAANPTKPTSIIYALGTADEATEYRTYDVDGNMTAQIDRGGVETDYSYDAESRVVQTITAAGTTDELTTETYYGTVPAGGTTYQVYTTTVHAAGEPATATVTTYDRAGRTVATAQYGGVKIDIATVSGAAEDGDLVVSASLDPDYLGTLLPGGTSTSYGAGGQMISTTDAANHATVYQYDAAGRLDDLRRRQLCRVRL